MKKSSLGFLLGFFFGILGLLGLFACNEQAEKDEFMSGWWKAFIVNIIIVAVLIGLVSCLTYQALETDYYYLITFKL